MVRPILAVVQKEDGVFVASFVDANINASGESQLDAVEMLQNMVASTFRLLSKKYKDVLGEAADTVGRSQAVYSGTNGRQPSNAAELTSQGVQKITRMTGFGPSDAWLTNEDRPRCSPQPVAQAAGTRRPQAGLAIVGRRRFRIIEL